MLGHSVVVRPVRVHRVDATLYTNVVSVVGYRAFCSCGWRSAKRRSMAEARIEGRGHREEVAENRHEPTESPGR
jgi:hypothetical protein